MNELKRLKWSDYFLLYGIPTLLNYIACQLAIPYLKANSSLPMEIIYFICVGGIALVPMFFGALYLTKKEINSGITTQKMDLADSRSILGCMASTNGTEFNFCFITHFLYFTSCRSTQTKYYHSNGCSRNFWSFWIYSYCIWRYTLIKMN